MNAEILLQYFKRISEAPDSIQHLRRFILDLAVRGKLVEQDPNDEPAAELLKRIQTENNNVANVATLLADNELPFQTPSSWIWVPIGNATYVEMGQSPPSENYNQSRDGLPFFQGKADFGKRNPTPRYWCNKPTKLAKQNDILMSVRAPVGPTNVASEECCIGRGLAALQPHKGVDLELLLYWLKAFEPKIAEMGFGTTFVAINKKQLISFPLPLPPLAEQRRIVAKVDELMALCDQLEAAKAEREQGRDRLVAASLQRLNQPAGDGESFSEDARFTFNHLPRITTRPEHIKQLRQTILNLAVRGKLVPQDPNDESISVLLERIKLDQHNSLELGLLKQRVHVNTQEEGGCLYPIPDEWCWLKLANLITFGPQNGISPKETKDNKSPKAITLTATTSGIFNASYYKHVELPERYCETYWLSSGDVLFQRGNTREYVGMAAIFDGPEKSFVFPDLMIRVRFSKYLELRFAHMALISPPLRQYFSREASGASATMPKINQTVLFNAPVPLPPIAEQLRIVAKVDELMALCDQLETQLTIIETDSRRLLESVLHEALAPALEEAA